MKGYCYPSSVSCRCPRHHACLVTKKCQSYDPNQLDCHVCETRVYGPFGQPHPELPLGGMLADAEHHPDLQWAVHTLEKRSNKPLAHPDMERQELEPFIEIAEKMEKERLAADILANFQALGIFRMEEQIVHALVDPDLAALLGPMA